MARRSTPAPRRGGDGASTQVDDQAQRLAEEALRAGRRQQVPAHRATAHLHGDRRSGSRTYGETG